MELQSALSALHVATDRSAVVAALQDITARLLRRGVFEVSGVECRPLELESYFYRTGLFEDAYVHENERQRNHFGELYVHRIGPLASSHYKMDNRVCVGLSLSDSTDFYYSALIRSARFSDGSEVFGPNNVLTAWARRINEQTHTLSPTVLDQLRPGGHDLVPLFPLMKRRLRCISFRLPKPTTTPRLRSSSRVERDWATKIRTIAIYRCAGWLVRCMPTENIRTKPHFCVIISKRMPSPAKQLARRPAVWRAVSRRGSNRFDRAYGSPP